jgi:hypothetical protein
MKTADRLGSLARIPWGGDMRVAAAFLLLLTTWTAPALSAPSRMSEFTSAQSVLAWINGYRRKPEPERLPAAIQAMSQYGALRDPESAGVYVGFIAGVIGADPDGAGELIARAFPIDAEDHWAIVRAVAHSGLPHWKHLLAELAYRMPGRQVMIGKYIDGSLPTLVATVPQKKPSTVERIKRVFSGAPAKGPAVDWALDASPEVLDMLWGRYFATGDYGPILRIVGFLPWSLERDSVDKLTLGAMAKYTLASNSARDADLLSLLKRSARQQPKETAVILKEITDAADTMQLSVIRKDAMAALEDLKRKGPGWKRDAMTAGRLGEGAIALGCIGAAATGQVALGLPCVVGGAVASAALRTWSGQ